MADVPGLIPGAAQGRGLGHDFLRHVERCSTLVHVIDCATEEPGRDPAADLAAIEAELTAYGDSTGAELVRRPRLIALNKIDIQAARERAEKVKAEFEARGHQVFEISAATGEGLRQLGFAMAALVAADRAARPAELPAERVRVKVAVKAADEPGFEVIRLGDSFLIRGEKPQRWVSQTDFSNDEAVSYLADRPGPPGRGGGPRRGGRRTRRGSPDRRPGRRRGVRLGPAAPMSSGASANARTAGIDPKQRLGPRGTDPRLLP